MAGIDGKVFASKAKSGEIADFPDIERGWGVTESTGFIPTMEHFNGFGKRIDLHINELNKTKANLTDLDVLLPAGTIIQSASKSTPQGYLKCNGASISRVSYKKLFEVIRTTFGSDDNNTFRLPDLRGRFIRGFSDGSSLDSGRAFGSYQNDENKEHYHLTLTSSGEQLSETKTIQNYKNFLKNNGYPEIVGEISIPPEVAGKYVNYEGKKYTDFVDFAPKVPTSKSGSESRPYNIALNFYIKY